MSILGMSMRFTGTLFVSLFLLLLLVMSMAMLWYPLELEWDKLPAPSTVTPIVFFDNDVDSGIYSNGLEHVVVCEGVEVFRFYCGGVP